MLLEQELIGQVQEWLHGLRVDAGRWKNNVHLDKKDRLCLECKSSQCVEDDATLLLIALCTVMLEPDMQVFFSIPLLFYAFFATCEPNACCGFMI